MASTSLLSSVSNRLIIDDNIHESVDLNSENTVREGDETALQLVADKKNSAKRKAVVHTVYANTNAKRTRVHKSH